MKANETKIDFNVSELIFASGTFLSFLLLGALVFALFSPVVKTNAANYDTIQVTTTVNPVLSVASPNTISLSNSTVNPNANGVFVSNSGTVTVTTNSTNGYKLYISSNTSNVNLSSSTTDTPITPCASGATSSNMVKDRWGYSIDSGSTYRPITASDVQIKSATSSSDSSMTVYFGAKISTATKAGTYSNVVKFTGIVNSL